ncbi:TAXI family TRAP transporter solute-binding subunit [Roseicyclus sp.]|uniref:TAXI family TRAP transporter solute-binding subunit n=1 Tax=Roseicyclus sp. TaxID=1914329 RepID=UPI003F9F5ECA
MTIFRTAVSVLALAFAAPATAQDAIVIGTGSTGGAYYPIGVGMARIVSDADPTLRVDAVSSGGSTENVQLIARGEIEIGITNGVVATLAARGEDVFEGDARTGLRALFALYGNTEHHVALADAVTTGTVDDLAALPGLYNIGGRQSGARTAANLMLRALGHDPDAIDMEFIGSYSEAGAALQDRRIAAANLGAGVPVPAVTELYAALGADRVRILSFTPDQLARIEAAHPGLYYGVTIPADSYPGQTEDISTAEYANLMVVDESMDEDTVYRFTRAVFENLEAIHAIHPSAAGIRMETALNGLPVRLHPGAVRYFEEVGISIPEALR